MSRTYEAPAVTLFFRCRLSAALRSERFRGVTNDTAMRLLLAALRSEDTTMRLPLAASDFLLSMYCSRNEVKSAHPSSIASSPASDTC